MTMNTNHKVDQLKMMAGFAAITAMAELSAGRSSKGDGPHGHGSKSRRAERKRERQAKRKGRR